MAEKVIVYISPHRSLYGAERSLISMMKGAREGGYKPVLIINGHGEIETELDKQHIEYIVHPFTQWINMDGKREYYIGLKCLVKNIIFSRKLTAILKEKYPNIVMVHSNTIITDFGLHLAARLHVPHIYHIREFGKLDFQMAFNFGERISAHFINKSARIICISDAVKEYYSEILNPDKLVRIYNGIPKPARCSSHKMNDICRFILVGRISSEKGQEEVIQAVKSLMPYKIEVDFFGNGVDEEKLKSLTSELGLDTVINFKGYSTNIPYEDYDVAIMASTAEAFGRVTAEYMLYGLPVIGANTGATTELVTNNVTGLIYEKGNVNQLAMAMKKLVDDPVLRASMGIEGKKKAEHEFTEDRYWNNIVQVYREVEDM